MVDRSRPPAINTDIPIMPHLEAACARGWAVFPCKGKSPATRTGVYAGTSDIVRWRTQFATQYHRGIVWNYGVWTGGSNLVVIDCDVPKEGEGEYGLPHFLEICEKFGDGHDPYETYAVVTPSFGMHFYYSYDMDEGEYIPPSVGKLAVSVDVRSAGSYVVGAGSQIDGKFYEDTGVSTVQPLPRFLCELLIPRPSDPAKRTKQIVEDARAYKDDALKIITYLADDVRQAPVGERNVTFAAKLWRVLHWDDEECVDILIDAARDAGLTDREIEAAVKSARRKHR